jgi:hypothetical protein
MEMKQEKRYQLLSTYEQRSGSCLECDQKVSVEVRTYLDRETDKPVIARVRSACQCERYQQEHDPYAGK